MTVAEMADFVCKKVEKTDANHVAMAKDFIRIRYKMLYEGNLWRDSLIVVGMPGAEEQVIFPKYVDKVLRTRFDTMTLVHEELATIFDIDPLAFDEQGYTARFTHLEPVATESFPDGKKIRVKSNSDSDTNKKVFVKGNYQGEPIFEEITLTGQQWAESTKTYDDITILSKVETVGGVIVQTIDEVALQEFEPDELSHKHCRIWLMRAPKDTSAMVLALCKRKVDLLKRDLDEPLLRNAQQFLLDIAEGDMLQRLRQFSKANVKFQEAMAQRASMIEQETNQSASNIRIVPEPYE